MVSFSVVNMKRWVRAPSLRGELERSSLVEVLVANETDADVEVERLEAAVRTALLGTMFAEGMISVAIVDDPTIHQLNRQYLQHDYPTDVLSFTLESAPPRLVGEIVASIDTAAELATEAGWSAAEELVLYVVHGTLHLAGYEDKAPEAGSKMRAAELAVLRRLGITPSPSDVRWRTGAAREEGSS
jgi:probable rRNA maturation factor